MHWQHDWLIQFLPFLPSASINLLTTIIVCVFKCYLSESWRRLLLHQHACTHACMPSYLPTYYLPVFGTLTDSHAFSSRSRLALVLVALFDRTNDDCCWHQNTNTIDSGGRVSRVYSIDENLMYQELRTSSMHHITQHNATSSQTPATLWWRNVSLASSE
jgi:hypothetical protein